MSAVLDPVTGLPDLSSSPLDQIPLGAQLVDWNGLKASQLPTRAPVYPDDGFPVLADLQAWQNGNPDAIQKLFTDNNHALWVSVVNGSSIGGGSASYAAAKQGITFELDSSAFTWDVGPSNWNGATKLYTVHIGYVVDTTGPAWLNPIQTIKFSLASVTAFQHYALGGFVVGGSAAAPTPLANSATITFPGGLPLTDGANNPITGFHVDCGQAKCYLSIGYYAG